MVVAAPPTESSTERDDSSPDGPPLAKPYRSAVVEKLVESTSRADASLSAARTAERERDSVDARLWATQRHQSEQRRVSSIAWEVEMDTRARLGRWTPDDIASWRPTSPPKAWHHRRAGSPVRLASPVAATAAAAATAHAAAYYSGYSAPPTVSASVGLIMAREAGERQAVEARAAEADMRTAEAESEVTRLSAELTSCRLELARNRRLADELRGAMRRHNRDLAQHSRQQVALAVQTEVGELRHAHRQLREGAAREINAMQDWLTETLGGLQQLVGKTASMAAAERWYMQRSLQSHLDTVTQEIKSQVSADFRRYIQPPSPATPPHPPWSQAARGLKSKGTPYPGKHPSEILEEMSGGAGTRAASSLGFLQSLSATSNRATQSLSATSSREWP
jgi:uncharacterized coiled-coil protein SlyX